ncbi:MAG: C39 family peptidase [Clostridiales bacterium]|nr:C39 family peptidase [Clostridiales bacterium]
MKSTNRFVPAVLACSVIAATCLTPIALAYEDIGVVDIPKVRQEKSLWCWAACTESILRYYGKGVTQEDVVRYTYDSTINSTAKDEDVQDALSHWGVDGTLTQNSVSSSIVSGEIKGGNPLYAGWSWRNGGGHALVIDGYDKTSGTMSVEYMDPGDGAFHASTYTYFKGGSGYDHIWDGTIYNLTK